MQTTEALREFRRSFAVRWFTYILYASGPVLLIGFMLLLPDHPDLFAWPGSLAWLLPVFLYPMLLAGIRMDLRALRFWTALGPRLSHAYYSRGGVTAVFDTHLVAQTPMGLRLSLFFDESMRVLSPTTADVGLWEYRSQHILSRGSELDGGGTIPQELRRIRQTLSGRPPHGPLANQQLLLTEHTKPIAQWPKAWYCIRLSLAIPRSQMSPQGILNEIDDVTQFLIESAGTLLQSVNASPAPSPASE